MVLRLLLLALGVSAIVVVAGALFTGSTDQTTAAGPSYFDSVDAGYWHTCGVTSVSGGAMCWGNNVHGEVGDGTLEGVACPEAKDPGAKCRLTPVDVVGLTSGVSSISAGYEHTCAVVDGGAKCWGDNEFGQLGDGQSCGTDDKCPTPVDVCAVDATAPCDDPGELLTGVLAIGASDGVGQENVEGSAAYHSCALVLLGPSDTQVQCWGQNEQGQLGNDTTTDSATPVVVQGLETDVVDMISVGYKHSCARILGPTEGKYSIKCWGANGQNQIDGPSANIHKTAVGLFVDLDGDTIADPVSDLDILSFDAGGYVTIGQTCVLTQEVTPEEVTTAAACTPGGSNNMGPGALALDGAVAISTAGPHACALMDDDGVQCWSSNIFGELGDGQSCGDLTCTFPVNVCADATCATDLTGVTGFTTGTYTSCALTSDGLSCWGNNQKGQLGDGTTTGRTTPVAVLIAEEDLVDTDLDGCDDARELQKTTGSETTGGLRNPKSFWDFFDVWTTPSAWERTRTVDISDINGVIARFGKVHPTSPLPSEPELVAEALTPPTDTTSYHTAFDRSAAPPGAPWQSGPPDGSIVIGDIGAVVAQFGHTCA